MMRTMATALLAATAVAATGENDSRRQLQAAPCTDLNSDGAVNVSDLLLLLAAFGTSDAGDSNADGVTDVADLLALLAAFGVPGQCAPGVATQPITFSPIAFESRNCQYDATAAAGINYISPAQLYTDALAAFNACPQPAGYCTVTLQTGIELSNRGVCGSGGDGGYAAGWNGFAPAGGPDMNTNIGCAPRPGLCCARTPQTEPPTLSHHPLSRTRPAWFTRLAHLHHARLFAPGLSARTALALRCTSVCPRLYGSDLRYRCPSP